MILKNVQIPYSDGWRAVDVFTSGGRIAAVSPRGSHVGAEGWDLGGDYLMCGFVDTHVHGAFGVDFDAECADFLRASRYLVSRGTTSFAPTLAMPDAGAVRRAVSAVRVLPEGDGARVCGLHLEGPFVSRESVGALDASRAKNPQSAEVQRLVEAADGMRLIITAAPELCGVEALFGCGAVVSVGHTAADYETAKRAVDGGFSRATHLFNAMPQMHHRVSTATALVLLDSRVLCELICDMTHVNIDMVRLALRLKGADGICMVSDGMSASGLEDGEYMLGGVACRVTDGVARLADGRLCGSGKTLADGVKNLLQMGVLPVDVQKMSSQNPARSLGFDVGMQAGCVADFVVLDKNFDVKAAFVGME